MSAMGPIYQPGEEHGYAEPNDDYQACANCTDRVYTLSSRGWCDGCEAEIYADPRGMVTMVGPNGSAHEVDRETAAEAANNHRFPDGWCNCDQCVTAVADDDAILADIERRVQAAYEQGKEVGRVNGAARLAALHDVNEGLRLRLEFVRRQRDTWAQADPDFPMDPRPLCGDGRCYCGDGCVS